MLNYNNNWIRFIILETKYKYVSYIGDVKIHFSLFFVTVPTVTSPLSFTFSWAPVLIASGSV